MKYVSRSLTALGLTVAYCWLVHNGFACPAAGFGFIAGLLALSLLE